MSEMNQTLIDWRMGYGASAIHSSFHSLNWNERHEMEFIAIKVSGLWAAAHSFFHFMFVFNLINCNGMNHENCGKQ